MNYATVEMEKINKLDALRRSHMPEPTARGWEPAAYKIAARGLGFHALHQDEIEDRKTELRAMGAAI